MLAFRLRPTRTGNIRGSMAWEVEYTNEFGSWWSSLTETHQDRVAASVGLLETHGPSLPFPYYAFDPRRAAILLIGGDKTGDDRLYERYVPLADRLYDDHLDELRAEGLI